MPHPTRRNLLRTLTAAALGACPAGVALFPASARAGFTLRGSAWEETAELAGLDPYLLYAIGLVESRHARQGRMQPWPFAVRTPKRSHYPDSQQAAVDILKTLSADEVRDSDLGWMQVNVRWHGHRVSKVENLLHPTVNLRVGALVLAEAVVATPGDLELAVGRYHTWMDESRARTYARQVLTVRRELRRIAGEPEYQGA